MSRKQAIRWLYGRHRGEWNFGWHDPHPATRAACRKEWPVSLVAKILRGDDYKAELEQLAEVQRQKRQHNAIMAELAGRVVV